MSGIAEIKKKAKLSMDEMFDNQSVGKLDNQKDAKTENHPNNQPRIQVEIKQVSQPPIHPLLQETINPNIHNDAQTEIQEAGRLTSYRNKEHQMTKQTLIFSATQQTQKTPTYKMTFNLPDSIYKAFNDLYAHRMLEGRKTDKSEMICEAIQWLIKMENEQAH